MSTVRCPGVPSSSRVREPRRFGRVASSMTVQAAEATRSPMRPENAEVPLRLKSPSKPWPTASCSNTPGQPGPSTTGMEPAGASTASRLARAWRTASRANSSARPCASGPRIQPKSWRPPPPSKPRSRRPSRSTITDTSKRHSGRSSAAKVPSLAATRLVSELAAMRAVTSFTRGSKPRAKASMRESNATFSGAVAEPIGSSRR